MRGGVRPIGFIHFDKTITSISNFLVFFFFPFHSGSLTELCPAGNTLEKSFSSFFHTMKEVKLEELEKSAALIQFSWNSSNFKRYEECKFRVIATIIDDKTNRNRGVFVSIRRLNLRKSPISEDCVDFIRFTFGKTKSPKYCGQLNASVDDVKKIYFGEGGGIIDVQIRLDKLQPLRKEYDTLDVELVFTANEGKRTRTKKTKGKSKFDANVFSSLSSALSHRLWSTESNQLLRQYVHIGEIEKRRHQQLPATILFG